MADEALRELDVVALVADDAASGLRRGQVGTVVALLGEAKDVAEVEFVDDAGRTYAILTLSREQLLPLKFEAKASGAAV